jgi:hypothetical protein
MKKRMPKPNHYYPKYGGWRFDQGNASVRSLAPPPIRICNCRGKMIREIPIFFVGERYHLQYLSIKKENIKGRSFVPQRWRFKTWRKILSVSALTLDFRSPFHPPRKNGKSSLQIYFFAMQPDLNTHSTNFFLLKSKQNCIKYRPSKTSQKISKNKK